MGRCWSLLVEVIILEDVSTSTKFAWFLSVVWRENIGQHVCFSQIHGSVTENKKKIQPAAHVLLLHTTVYYFFEYVLQIILHSIQINVRVLCSVNKCGTELGCIFRLLLRRDCCEVGADPVTPNEENTENIIFLLVCFSFKKPHCV